MSTINDLEKIYLETLGSMYSNREIKSIFKLLILELLKIDSSSYLINKNHIISINKKSKVIDCLNRLKAYEPIQYILGYTNFLDYKIKVNKSVLIPRNETEELVNWCKCFLKKNDKVIDLGTGSGCIAISLAKYNKVIALDKCNNSLKIAKLNAKNNKVNIHFIQDDILTFNKKTKLKEKQNIVISNPPYVLNNQIKKMHKNVYMYEPKSAIFVNNENPLVFYEKIILFSINNLHKNGLLFFEINELFGNEIVCLLKESNFNDIELKKDINGRDRMIKATLK